MNGVIRDGSITAGSKHICFCCALILIKVELPEMTLYHRPFKCSGYSLGISRGICSASRGALAPHQFQRTLSEFSVASIQHDLLVCE